MFCHLPFPPSTNNLWRVARNKVYKTSTARMYEDQVTAAMFNTRTETFEGDVAVQLTFFMPDNRRRDLDNLLKALLDALTAAGVWQDDSQVKHIEATVGHSRASGGLVHCQIEEMNG